MTTQLEKTYTSAEFMALPEDETRYELVEGRLSDHFHLKFNIKLNFDI